MSNIQGQYVSCAVITKGVLPFDGNLAEKLMKEIL